jgi:hypothetical protein
MIVNYYERLAEATIDRPVLLKEQAMLRALTWTDSRVTARLETIYRLLNT